MADGRRSPRFDAALVVNVETPQGVITCTSENLSETGVFVNTPILLGVGDVVSVRMALPHTDVPLGLTAEIVFVRTEEQAAENGMPQGMGMRFMDIPAPAAALLAEAADHLRQQMTGWALLVGRSPDVNKRLAGWLRESGFNVERAPSATEALDRTGYCTFSLIVAAQAPLGTTDFVAWDRLRSEARRAIPLLVLASSLDEGIEEQLAVTAWLDPLCERDAFLAECAELRRVAAGTAPGSGSGEDAALAGEITDDELEAALASAASPRHVGERPPPTPTPHPLLVDEPSEPPTPSHPASTRTQVVPRTGGSRRGVVIGVGLALLVLAAGVAQPNVRAWIWESVQAPAPGDDAGVSVSSLNDEPIDGSLASDSPPADLATGEKPSSDASSSNPSDSAKRKNRRRSSRRGGRTFGNRRTAAASSAAGSGAGGSAPVASATPTSTGSTAGLEATSDAHGTSGAQGSGTSAAASSPTASPTRTAGDAGSGATRVVVVRGQPTPKQTDMRQELLEKGHVALQAGQVVAARREYRKVVKLFDEYPDGHYWLAVAYALEDEHGRACREFERYVELAPQGSRAAEVRSNLQNCR